MYTFRHEKVKVSHIEGVVLWLKAASALQKKNQECSGNTKMTALVKMKLANTERRLYKLNLASHTVLLLLTYCHTRCVLGIKASGLHEKSIGGRS